uniref:VOC domain-containing protein n=1 Tax=Physcomitrium patens TaxID=3218 RepID=A0A2K1KM64_PHYPA|nr:hypothetical protein PHYPA_005752 [Physcomitrium patens]
MKCLASLKERNTNLGNWPREDNRHLLHVVYNVGNMEISTKWYQECLGMSILRKRDFPDEKYTNVFVGYDYGVTKFDNGDAFGHFGIAVPNLQKTLDSIKKLGYAAPSSPSEEHCDVFAIVVDPNGYKFKLIQRDSSREPFCQVSLHVGDINHSILYYQDAYGMKLIARKDFPAQKKAFAYLSYDMDKRRSTVLEFEYNYDKTNYSKGNGYAQLAIGTEDIYKTYEACEIIDGGQTVTIPTTSPNTNTKIYAVIDPDGWRTVEFLSHTALI